MSLRSFIKNNFIKPLQSIPVQWYYTVKKTYSPVNSARREHHIVVSLTSFPARFDTLHFALKSILCQRMMPDAIVLVLTKDEVKGESELPQSVLDLKKYGLQIFFADENLKPHNKYIYAMKMYPSSLVITVDDDNMYDKNMVQDLYNSYLQYPAAVSAKRVHKIKKDANNNVLPYTEWSYEYKKETEPSRHLLATGVGGVLYPPGVLPPETFDKEKIRELCLNADDIWLKFMQLKKNIPAVWVKTRRVHPLVIRKSQKITLQGNNYHKGQNDTYIAAMQNYFGINLGEI